MGLDTGHFAYGGFQNSYSFPGIAINRLGINTGNPIQMPSIEAEQIAFYAPPTNAGYVYIGTSAAMGTQHAIVLQPGMWTPYFPIRNLNNFWYKNADANSPLIYVLFH